MTFELFGIVKGQPIQSLAICSTLEVAEYHKEHTFGDFAGRVIIQETEKTQAENVQAIYDIASPIFKVDATMNATDWETMKCDITQTTAIALYEEGTLTDVEQLNVVALSPIERKKLKATMLVRETEGQPFYRLFSQMQEEILAYLTKGVAASTTKKKTNDVVAAMPVVAMETVTEADENPVTETVVAEEVVEEQVVEVAETTETATQEPTVDEVEEETVTEAPVTVETTSEVEDTVETATEETPFTATGDGETAISEEVVTVSATSVESDEDALVDFGDLEDVNVDVPMTTFEEPQTIVEAPPVNIPQTDVDDLLGEDDGVDLASFEELLNDI